MIRQKFLLSLKNISIADNIQALYKKHPFSQRAGVFFVVVYFIGGRGGSQLPCKKSVSLH